LVPKGKPLLLALEALLQLLLRLLQTSELPVHYQGEMLLRLTKVVTSLLGREVRHISAVSLLGREEARVVQG